MRHNKFKTQKNYKNIKKNKWQLERIWTCESKSMIDIQLCLFEKQVKDIR